VIAVGREIEERREFLDEMQKLGAPNFRQYEALVRNEITVKTDELERLRYGMELDDHDMEDSDRSANIACQWI